MRELVHLRTTRQLGDAVMVARVVVGACCRTLVGSGLVEASRVGPLGTVTIRIGASTLGRCARQPQRGR